MILNIKGGYRVRSNKKIFFKKDYTFTLNAVDTKKITEKSLYEFHIKKSTLDNIIFKYLNNKEIRYIQIYTIDYYDKKSDCMNINCIIFVNAVYIRKLKIENLLK